MILTVQIPVLVPEIYGKFKNRISYTTKLMPIVTRVVAVRRTVIAGEVEADAFIKDEYRRQIDGAKSKWIDAEYRRCVCYVEDNPKTLRAFLESGDAEWDLRGDK